MDPATIISLSVAGLTQLVKAIELANNGQIVEAEAALRDARTHFDTSLEAWDAAPGPQ
jgi:hypothetical protein